VVATGQSRKQLEIAANQRLLLFAPPPFDLSLGFDSVGDSLKLLMVDKRHRATPGRVAAESTCLMLGDAAFKALSRRTNVVGTVGAAQDIKPSPHQHPTN
jgi:hypothetical protein